MSTRALSRASLVLLEHFRIIKKGTHQQAKRQGFATIPIPQGWVEPHILYAQVLNNRPENLTVIDALHRVGFEDPFAQVPEIDAYVDGLFSKHRPQTDLQKAILLFRAVLPSKLTFSFGESEYTGLPKAKGGLEIPFTEDFNAGIRLWTRSSLLPRDLISEPSRAEMYRVAVCREYTYLLVALLRASGIESHFNKVGMHHANVAAVVDGQHLKLEALLPGIEVLDEMPATIATDYEATAFHYNSRGNVRGDQGYPRKAMALLDIALEIKPDLAQAWNNRGVLLLDMKQFAQGLEALDKALKFEPNDSTIWSNKGVAHLRLEQKDAAEAAFRKSLEIDPGNRLAQANLDRLLGRNTLFDCMMGRRDS